MKHVGMMSLMINLNAAVIRLAVIGMAVGRVGHRAIWHRAVTEERATVGTVARNLSTGINTHARDTRSSVRENRHAFL